MDGRGPPRGRRPRGAPEAMGRRLLLALLFTVLLYTDTHSSTTSPMGSNPQPSAEEILRTTLLDPSPYEESPYASRMFEQDPMDQFTMTTTPTASSMSRSIAVEPTPTKNPNYEDSHRFAPTMESEGPKDDESLLIPEDNLNMSDLEEASLPATLGLGYVAKDGRLFLPPPPPSPEGSGPTRVVWGEVGRGLVSASSGDDRGEVFPAGRRPALLVPGASNRGRARSGPYFEEDSPLANVTAPSGSTVMLDCRVAMLHDKVVTWAARRADRLQLLTVGRQPYSADKRVALSFKYPNNWRLQIEEAKREDQGLYECQVAAHPPIIRQIYLTVISPEVSIFDESGRSVVERYYKAGSFLQLTCSAVQLLEPPSMLSWWQGSTPLTDGISCNVTGPDSATCTLVVEHVTRAHAGTYTCGSGSAAVLQSAAAPEVQLGAADPTLPAPALTYSANASVAVHVLHGNLIGVAVLPNTGKSIGAKGGSNISVQEIVLGIAIGLIIQSR